MYRLEELQKFQQWLEERGLFKSTVDYAKVFMDEESKRSQYENDIQDICDCPGNVTGLHTEFCNRT